MIFIIVSVLLLIFTLVRTQKYRFYRFLAFEVLLILVLLNADFWFQHPFSIIQLISWIFLLGSLLLAIHGFRLLKVAGAPAKDIEDTTNLITTGAYCYIRHPLFFSLFLGGTGAFLKYPDIKRFLLLLCLFIFLYLASRIEEKENLEKFGAEYRQYMQKTKMFIPFLF
jgi:protein-S-isoprenylcysteine O-methyltransferase Ste14